MARRDQSRRLLDQAFIDIAATRRIADKRLANLRLAGEVLQGTDYDRAGGKGGISDPTPLHADQYSHWHQALFDAEQAIIVLAGAAAHTRRTLEQAPSDIDTVRIAKQNQCTGGPPYEGADVWGEDPAHPCEKVAAYTEGHNAGLCANHVRYRNEWEKKQRELSTYPQVT